MPPVPKYVKKRQEAVRATLGKEFEVLGAFHTIPPYGRDQVQDRPMMSTAGCGFCLKVGEYENFTLQKCAKCHRAFYCSKECQKSDWSEHKRSCGHWDEEDHKVIKMAWRVHHTQELRRPIEQEIGQRYLVEFADAQDLDSRKVRIVDVCVYFRPSSQDMHFSSDMPNEKLQGCFQVYKIQKRKLPLPNVSSESPEFDKVRRLWAAHRQAADRAGLQLYPLVLVQYRYKNQPILLSSVVFTPQSFDTLRTKGPTNIYNTFLGICWADTLPSGIRAVNNRINQDKDNKLGLIKRMSEYDKGVYPLVQIGKLQKCLHTCTEISSAYIPPYLDKWHTY